ncbi:hypothetical protein [Spirosoma sp. 209]|uniref:hypothetical protein n=1 Tax=Spirosoma sp. 209 TaxID=1955701 RepID=UPI00098D2F70|nr:hypothetical protein [Spirosoma sp. 209]
MAILISVLALLATFYQLHLQRVHNEKSLKPLGQIELPDHNKQLAVHIRNNGLGPLLIDRLTFVQHGQSYTAIDDCLALEPRSYMRVTIDDTVKRVILPHAYLVVFETRFDEHEREADINCVRKQLASITLTVEGRDMYDNHIVLTRNFNWFSRYLTE